MATINTESIENFDSMTAEQKVEALLGLDIPESVDLSAYVKKSVFDAKASEAAELSKKLKGKMSEDELAIAERERIQAESEAKYAELENKYNELIKKSTIAEYKAKFLAQGYDDKLAQSTAEALANGDMERVFANSETFKNALEKKIKSDIMAANPNPNGASGQSAESVDVGVEKAKQIGKIKAENNQKSADILKNYF